MCAPTYEENDTDVIALEKRVHAATTLVDEIDVVLATRLLPEEARQALTAARRRVDVAHEHLLIGLSLLRTQAHDQRLDLS